MALLNSGSLATNVRVLALDPSGEILGSFATALRPGERISRLIHELVPEAAGSSGGLIWVNGSLPIHMTSLFGNRSSLANIPPQLVPADFRPDRDLTALELNPSLAIVPVRGSQRFRLDNGSREVTWKVNGVVGGNASVGFIDGDGFYSTTSQTPVPQVVTVTAESNQQTAGASVDILDKQTLFSSVSKVQSIAYLGSLKKLYTAELALLSTAASRSASTQELSRAAGPAAETTSSTIFEVGSRLAKVQLAAFPGETIAKILPFRAADGREYLLLAARTTGRIIRLDPRTQRASVLVRGLSEPSTLVIDPVTDNLLVAEKQGITMIAREVLELDLISGSSSARGDQVVSVSLDRSRARQTVSLATAPAASDLEPSRVSLLQLEDPAGLVVDGCTGNFFLSNRESGELLEYDRAEQVFRTVAVLESPGPLVATYRSGVACPDSLQLLVAEEGAGQITLVVPSEDRTSFWMEAGQTSDILFLPPGTPFAALEAVLLAEIAEGNHDITIVKVPAAYKTRPAQGISRRKGKGPCPGKFVLPDSKLNRKALELLGIPDGEEITCEAAKGLKNLNAQGLGIRSLQGLEFFPNLQSLRLSDNRIVNILSLAELQELTELYLDKNAIQGVGALLKLSKLRILNLAENAIEDVAPLALNPGLGNGDDIDITSNPIPEDDFKRINALMKRGARVKADCNRAQSGSGQSQTCGGQGGG